jgi:crotonobetainyl-CoA:carnitine CoA-transferase CaiB-like acyl-CoA transferase
MGNTGYSGLPTAALFETRDRRRISLGVVQPRQFIALAQYLGRVDWLEDPRFATQDAQRVNFDALYGQLAAEFEKRDAADWEREMSERGIPCGMVRRVGDAAALAGEGALQAIAAEGSSAPATASIAGVGFRMTPDGPDGAEPPPRLDGNREEILAWLESQVEK